ncbi:hypothetical protein [Streptomyces bicolor]|uniref:hypothetical protein n=1 Tax=Streptomyces bicolor TaxID=66874 RepID=UPI00131DDD9C|nr:hypothetical protein [Streptomyces bicolor]
MPETGSAVAWSTDKAAGLAVSCSALPQAYAAKEPSHWPKTSSPAFTSLTFGLTASTALAARQRRTR